MVVKLWIGLNKTLLHYINIHKDIFLYNYGKRIIYLNKDVIILVSITD